MNNFPRRIAHFDLDTFFVAVERTLDASLIGKPVLVGGKGIRSVVAAASYESRNYGCHSAQPMSQALRLCPNAVVVSPKFDEYRRVSKLFHSILSETSPVVESVGIDEAYVDLTGIPINNKFPHSKQFSTAGLIADNVRKRVKSELEITVSVCIAETKTTAKVGSDQAKPDGLIEIAIGNDKEFLSSLPIRELPMVGPKLAEALSVAGVKTIGDIALLNEQWLEQRFGRLGQLLFRRANGIDQSEVRSSARPARSISKETTFRNDVTDIDLLFATLMTHSQKVTRTLRDSNKRAKTVSIKLRWDNFETVTRNCTLDRPTQSSRTVFSIGKEIVTKLCGKNSKSIRPVRLIGIAVTNLIHDEIQLELNDLMGMPNDKTIGGELFETRIDSVLDQINSRFGELTIHRGI